MELGMSSEIQQLNDRDSKEGNVKSRDGELETFHKGVLFPCG